MKRIVYFSIEEDGRKRVQSISAPVDESKIDLLENMGLIDARYTDPEGIEGKKISLYYNDSTNLIDVEYSDVTFEDLTPVEQVKYLKKENQALKEELALTQECVMALDSTLLELTGDNTPVDDKDSIIDIPETSEPDVPESFDLVTAIDNAKDGDTIVIPEDVHLSNEIYMNKQLTIDLAGHSIISDKTVFTSRSSKCDVTITGNGTIQGGSGGNYKAISASAGKFTLENGTYSVGANENNEGNSCIYVSAIGVIEIIDGYYRTDAPYKGSYNVLTKKEDSNGQIIVFGGTFENYNPGIDNETDVESFVADGYESIMSETENTYVVIKKENADSDVTNNKEDNNTTEEDTTNEDVEIKEDIPNETEEESTIVDETPDEIDSEETQEDNSIDESIDNSTTTNDTDNESTNTSEEENPEDNNSNDTIIDEQETNESIENNDVNVGGNE